MRAASFSTRGSSSALSSQVSSRLSSVAKWWLYQSNWRVWMLSSESQCSTSFSIRSWVTPQMANGRVNAIPTSTHNPRPCPQGSRFSKKCGMTAILLAEHGFAGPQLPRRSFLMIELQRRRIENWFAQGPAARVQKAQGAKQPRQFPIRILFVIIVRDCRPTCV